MAYKIGSSGGGAGTITGDSGGAISQSAGNWTFTGAGGLSVSGSGSTLTFTQSGGSGGVTWSVITADQTAAVNNYYVANKAGLLTLTMPSTAAVGSVIGILNINTAAGVQVLSANPGQLVFQGVSATANTGHFDSTALGDAVYMVCVVANTTWQVTNSQGNWSIT